jgi:hypothetical protein
MGSASRGRDWTPAQAVRLPLDPSGRPTVPSRVFRSRKLAARGMLICWYCCVSVEVRSIHDGPSHASRFVRQRDGHDKPWLSAEMLARDRPSIRVDHVGSALTARHYAVRGAELLSEYLLFRALALVRARSLFVDLDDGLTPSATA